MPTMRKTSILILVLLLIACTQSRFAADGGASLIAGDRAFSSHDIGRAAKLYRAVAASETGETRAKARLRLALLEWRFYGQDGKAQGLLQKVIRNGEESSDAWAMISRLEDQRGRFSDARKAGLHALLEADLDTQAARARRLWAKAAVDEIEASAAHPKISPDVSSNEVESVAKTLVQHNPGDLAASRILLRAALINRDGGAALEAWRSYYRVPPGGEPYDLLRAPYATLQKILPDWDGANPAINTKLVLALGGSRFFHEAALVASRYRTAKGDREDVAQLLAYAGLIRSVKSLTDDYYRELAVGKGNRAAWLKALSNEFAARWQSLRIPGRAPVVPADADLDTLRQAYETSTSAIEKALGARFGTYINVGTTAGYLDLHMGHEVSRTERVVNQYGHQAKVTLILLDSMVSNGFESWAWDFRSQHGGWANSSGIYQVRPAYAKGPVRDWQKLTNPRLREKWDEEITRDSASDEAIAAKNPYAYLPGLSGRLKRASLESLLSRLRSKGLTGADLRTAFLHDLEGATRDSSIFAHEGRHVIDKQLGITSNVQLEFRAKLSEIAFAELPRLALSNSILAANLGDQTPHGQANLRVIRALVGWMNHHRGEIGGLHPSKPLLPQLDLLTPDQLRAAARSADPLANREAQAPPRDARREIAS